MRFFVLAACRRQVLISQGAIDFFVYCRVIYSLKTDAKPGVGENTCAGDERATLSGK